MKTLDYVPNGNPLPDKELETKVTEILLAEYGRLRDETFSVESRYDRVVSVAVTLVGVLFLYGMQKNVKEVFFVLPFLIYAIVFYVLHFFHAMCVRAGYLRVIEGEINRASTREVLIWENHIVPRFLCLRRYPAAMGFNLAVSCSPKTMPDEMREYPITGV